MHAYFLFILPPNKFLLRFKFSSLTVSKLLLFLLVSEVKFHETNIKKIYMVSIYSLRPVNAFLYICNNKWQCNSFFFTKKRKFWDFVVQKKFFWSMCTTLNPPSPLVCNCAHLALCTSPPLPLCVYVLCGWLLLVPCLWMEVCPYSYFWWCEYFLGPWMSFCYCSIQY